MGTYIRLIDYDYAEKEKAFTKFDSKYVSSMKAYKNIPGCPFAYWIGLKTKQLFEEDTLHGKTMVRMGLTTGNNEYYLRYWYEVKVADVGFQKNRNSAMESKKKWFPYNKGGEYRKWYGNREYVVNWYNDGYEMRTKLHPSGTRIWAHNFNLEYNFRKHICWNDIVTKKISFRAFEEGFLFDSAAAVSFVSEEDYFWLLGYLNCSIVDYLSKIINPTLHFKLGDFEKLPYLKCDELRISDMAQENVKISKEDWDSFESSWDFQRHPLI